MLLDSMDHCVCQVFAQTTVGSVDQIACVVMAEHPRGKNWIRFDSYGSHSFDTPVLICVLATMNAIDNMYGCES